MYHCLQTKLLRQEQYACSAFSGVNNWLLLWNCHSNAGIFVVLFQSLWIPCTCLSPQNHRYSNWHQSFVQSVHLANRKSCSISGEAVYACTGNASPTTVNTVRDWLLTETIEEAAGKIEHLQRDQGLSLADLVVEVGKQLVDISMPAPVKIKLTIQLAEIEHRLSKASSELAERVHRFAFVGAFMLARDGIVNGSWFPGQVLHICELFELVMLWRLHLCPLWIPRIPHCNKYWGALHANPECQKYFQMQVCASGPGASE